MPRTAITVRPLTAAAVYWQLRRLRRAQQAGNALDALAAAARVHALSVRPNLGHGRWPLAHASCERILSRIPGRQTRGYSPQLRGVIECLHADAAYAAREAGEFQQAKRHLLALAGYLSDRCAPTTQQALVLMELAYLYIAVGEARAGGRILAEAGALLTGCPPAPAASSRPASAPGWPVWPVWSTRSGLIKVPAQRRGSD